MILDILGNFINSKEKRVKRRKKRRLGKKWENCRPCNIFYSARSKKVYKIKNNHKQWKIVSILSINHSGFNWR